MTFDLERLSVNPQFYDALSGEFKSPLDPELRPRTLGRLAIATIAYGDQIDDIRRGATFSYEPTWAQGVESRVICDILHIAEYRLSKPSYMLAGLFLGSDYAGRLDVYEKPKYLRLAETQSEDTNRGLIISKNTNPIFHKYSQNIDDNNDTLRGTIADTAKKFFDTHGQEQAK